MNIDARVNRMFHRLIFLLGISSGTDKHGMYFKALEENFYRNRCCKSHVNAVVIVTRCVVRPSHPNAVA